MRIAFINFYPTDTMARYMLSSYILKGYLEKHYAGKEQLEIKVFNYSNNASIAQIPEKILKWKPDIIGYSCYTWNINEVLELIDMLGNKDLDVTHILGGPEITVSMIEAKSSPAEKTYFVIGEGERKLNNLIKYLEEGEKKLDETVPSGVAYWKESKLEYDHSHEVITDLDEIPSIYCNEIIEDRLYAKQQAFIETQRGCRFNCQYCIYPKFLSSINVYSEQRVREEVYHLIVNKKVTALRIFDAIFTSDLDRAKSLIRYLVQLKNEKDVQIPWLYWEFISHSIDEEFMELTASLKYRSNILNTNSMTPLDKPQHYSELLKDYTVINCIGLQSFNRESLKAVQRPGISKDRLGDFMGKINSYNIVLKIDLILGLPHETFDTFFEGLEIFLPFLKNTDHVLNIHRLQILPGSPLENAVETYGILYLRKSPQMVYATNTLSEEEFKYALKLTAVLFRILNSPLRKYFYSAKEKLGISFFSLLEDIYSKIVESEDLKNSQLVQQEYVDDEYWNNDIYREVPSAWIAGYLQSNIFRDRSKIGKTNSVQNKNVTETFAN